MRAQCRKTSPEARSACREQSCRERNGKSQRRQFNGYATQQASDYADLAIQDPETNRFLVDIHPLSDRVKAEKLVRSDPEAIPFLHPHGDRYQISRRRRGGRFHLPR